MSELPVSSTVNNMKIVVVGDGAIGKTCLLMSYTKGVFPDEYIPTENKEVTIEKPQAHIEKVRLDLWDTAGQEEFDRIRPLSYRDADYFLICFSVNSMTSFEHLAEKWVPEVKHHEPNKGFLFVGLKSDLREENSTTNVPTNKIMELVKELGAESYVECSALKNNNINNVFDTAMKKYLDPKNKHRRKQTNKNSENNKENKNNNDNKEGGKCCIIL